METMSKSPIHLLNKDGSCFTGLAELAEVLGALENDARIAYRNENARAIANDDEPRIVVVAGPGAGKSYLFIDRIKAWLDARPDGQVRVATFVRKLIRDLERDIEAKLTPEEAERVQASTLHTLARSLVERNGGTVDLPLSPYVRVVDSTWARVVWRDVLAFHPDFSAGTYSLRRFEDQLHTEEVDDSAEWGQIRATHDQLTQFYNAVGFSQFITLAREAIIQSPDLIENDLWIIDEYQDFNAAEDHLVRTLVREAAGVMLAGDDEQALYQTLKASMPEIIIGYYTNTDFAKAMLPFCSRCSYYVCTAASAFMAKYREGSAIEKIYLPLTVDQDAPKVRVVATAAPGSAVEYIRAFMDESEEEFRAYLERRDAGIDTDPFLLIVSPSGGLTPKKNDDADRDLTELVGSYAARADVRSRDYHLIATYSSVGWYPRDNFAVRKLLHEAGTSFEDVHAMLEEALSNQIDLAEVVERRTDLMEKARSVAALLDGSEGDEDNVAGALSEIIDLENAPALALELHDHPLRESAVRTDEDDRAIDSAVIVDAVALMPITGSKGLSAHHVIVLGCDNVNMGKTSPLTFFVALTRARRSLHLVFAAKASGASALHQFVLDLPEACCDYLVFKKDRSVERLASRTKIVQRVATWSSFRPRRRTG